MIIKNIQKMVQSTFLAKTKILSDLGKLFVINENCRKQLIEPNKNDVVQ